ncbi:MAG TPA: TetR/AcrR family transcriptional regulator [Promicromonospora sp.]|nr:TetR/AcrR family transcriptional regulator [Promicromonospora sp.]
MAPGNRRERERAEREQLIIRTARELAETEGWEAVTTRRLAAEIEYSQPVLYSHFSGKAAIMTAVAAEGFVELATALRAARTAATGVRESLAAVARAYTDFARERPALYDAMFTHAVDLQFASETTPDALQAGFAEFLEVVGPVAGPDAPGLLAETFWAGLHGLALLERSGRLLGQAHDDRLTLLIDRLTVPR